MDARPAPRAYPETLDLSGRKITLRLMTASDRDAMLAFGRTQPAHDLLFLRRDIKSEASVDAWLAEIAEGTDVTVLAVDAAEGSDGRFLGYATIDRSEIPWSRHVGEIRVLVGPEMRGKGLGRLLTHDVFALALAMGIEKVVAQMTLDQKGAVATFQALGFRPEAVLRDHVKDRHGVLHDLLVLTLSTKGGR